MKRILLSLMLVFVQDRELTAEVETVEIRWNAFKCLEPCVALVRENLTAIRTVSNIEIDPQAGIAKMDWDGRYPFSYEPFRAAAGGVGFKIREMRIRVLGKITHDANDFYLVSRGDGARFRLNGPILTQGGRYTPRYSLESHPLPPDIKDALLLAERNNFNVLIYGPLFLPSHWPRVLITEEIKVNPKERTH